MVCSTISWANFGRPDKSPMARRRIPSLSILASSSFKNSSNSALSRIFLRQPVLIFRTKRIKSNIRYTHFPCRVDHASYILTRFCARIYVAFSERAHRPLPSIMIATCLGSFSLSCSEKIVIFYIFLSQRVHDQLTTRKAYPNSLIWEKTYQRP